MIGVRYRHDVDYVCQHIDDVDDVEMDCETMQTQYRIDIGVDCDIDEVSRIILLNKRYDRGTI